jgi:hypothetical protein
MTEQMVLVKYDSNWADEFDMSGFIVMPQSKWETHKDKAVRAFKKLEEAPLPEPDREYSRANREARQIEVYFGTNESQIYETVDTYLRSFEVEVLTPEDLKTLERLFKSHGPPRSGHVVMIDDYKFDEILGEESEFTEDDVDEFAEDEDD